jgi:hypothetical protein
MTAEGRPPGLFGAVGLPEAVGFAIGAGAMAKALLVLEANLSGNPRVRRLVRDGVWSELERAMAEHRPAFEAWRGRGPSSDPEEQVEVPVGH